MNKVAILFRRLRPEDDNDIPVPAYMTPKSAGMDLFAAVTNSIDIPPGEVELIPTGFAAAIPEGFEAQIRPRSGLAAKHKIGLVNSPGTIDADYRGEIFIPVINWGKTAYTIKRGDRIAQMIISKVYQGNIELSDSLDETERNDGGFGHTGR